MNDIPLNQQQYSAQPTEPQGEVLSVVLRPDNKKKKGLFEILLIGIIIVIFLGILNYLNILPLSKLFPNQIQAPSTQQNPNFISRKISCPSVQGFCQVGSDIIKDGKYIGWGGSLASGSAIFAAFDGVVTSTTGTFQKEEDGQTSEKQFIIAYLDNSELGLRGTYYFRGSTPKTGKVSKGEQIATANGKKIQTYNDKSLIFSLFSGFPNNNNLVLLSKQSFE